MLAVGVVDVIGLCHRLSVKGKCHHGKNVTLNSKEQRRLMVLSKVLEGKMNGPDASRMHMHKPVSRRLLNKGDISV